VAFVRRTLRSPGLQALAGAVLLAVWPAFSAGQRQGPLGALGGLGVLMLAAAFFFGVPGLVAAPLVILAVEFALARILDAGSLAVGAPVYAVALVLVAERSYTALTPALRAPAERAVKLRRVGGLATLAVGTLGVGAVVLGVSAARTGESFSLEALGLVAGICLLALLVLLARRTSSG
jgi:hypothetical protein